MGFVYMYEILDYKSNKYWKDLLNKNSISSILFSPVNMEQFYIHFLLEK